MLAYYVLLAGRGTLFVNHDSEPEEVSGGRTGAL